MTAYGDQTKAVAGLMTGLTVGKQESWVAQEAINEGAPIFSYLGEAEKCYNFYNDTSKIVFDADFVASNTIDLDVNGVSIAQVTYATSHDNTAALLVNAIAALTGVECTLDATDTDSRTFLVQTVGVSALVTSVTVAAGASQAGSTVTVGSSQILIGVGIFVQKESAQYAFGELLSVLADDRRIFVTAGANVQANDDVYITTTGTFGNAGTITAWKYRETVSSGALVEIEVAGQKKLTYADNF